MISYSQLGKPTHGRLGNQLFQIASTLGIAEKNNTVASFPPHWKYRDHFEPLPNNGFTVTKHRENSYEWYDITTQDADLHGWFQSEKYFGSQRPVLRGVVPEPNTIAISIRRGDYIGNPNYYEIPVHWYISALLTIPDWGKHRILFFSDDLEYCRVHFECLPNAEFCSGSDIHQLRTMAGCEKHIIANSTFSWWGAYLSGSTHVIHSGRLFAGPLAEKHTGTDFYPERWTCHKGDKLNLTDTTFTIPVHYDHLDRRQNLDLSVCMLQRSFDTEIIIMEQGGTAFEYMAEWAKYCTIDTDAFHRTRMLNEMAEMATTPIIVNWDCDVIIPPMQIWLAAEALRNGADMVYPYDGRFARVPRNPWFNKIEQRLDIGIVINTTFKGKSGGGMAISSVGGAVMFNKDSFIDGGMENENMVSYAPEDCERYDRFKLLGYKVERIAGSLYHIDHWCGPNSNSRNPLFKANHAELDKIRLMDKDQLREYVDTWGWVTKYSPGYYRMINDGSISSAAEVFKVLPFQPASVIDVGCGVGAWVQPGIKWTGIDYRVPEKSLFEGVEYIDCNLEKEFPVINRADLCICLEVAEHLTPGRADDLIKYLCSLSDVVLFSAAIPYQGGTGHKNEQWQEWWATLFYLNGYCATTPQPEIRSNELVEYWYRQNIVLYKKGVSGNVTNFVLPEYYEQCMKNALRR
jgi:hypothetical protein